MPNPVDFKKSLLLSGGLNVMLFVLPGMAFGSFRKLGVPYLGVLIIRILLYRVLY